MNARQIERDKLCEAANALSAYCNHTKCGDDCFFLNERKSCRLSDLPIHWKEFNNLKWTEADVLLAKGLLAMGYKDIYAGPTVFDDHRVFARKVKGNYVMEEIRMPSGSFKKTDYFEPILLKDIIREAGEDTANEYI